MADEQVADVSAEPEVAPSGVLSATDNAVADSGNWRDSLPDDIKDHQSLQNIADVGALAKTMIHAQSMVGAEKIPVPGKWATDDDWEQVYSKLGRPEAADGYELDLGEGEVDEEFVGAFRDAAHKAGLTPRQAQQLAGWYNGMSAEGLAGAEAGKVDIEAAKAQATADLRQEYGKAYDERLTLGNNLIGEFGEEGLLDLRLEDGTPLINNAAFVKTIINAAHYINSSISEDKLVGDRGSAMTPAEADEKIQELMREDGPYWDGKHPMHESYVQQVLKLNEEKYPEEE